MPGPAPVRQPTGRAIIQVDQDGDNAIVLCAGANARIATADIDRALAALLPGDGAPRPTLLLQNEIGAAGAHALRRGAELGT